MLQFNNLYIAIPGKLKATVLISGATPRLFGGTGSIKIFSSRSAANRAMRSMVTPALFKINTTGMSMDRLIQVDQSLFYKGVLKPVMLKEIENVRSRKAVHQKRGKLPKVNKLRGRGLL